MPLRTTLLIGALSLLPDSASQTYVRVSGEVPREGVLRRDGWVFSAATSRHAGLSGNAAEVALAAASTAADGAFLPLAIELSSGKPDCVRGPLEDACRRSAASAIMLRMRIAGLVTVADDPGGDTARCVRALPESALPPRPMPWPAAWHVIQESARSLEDLALIAEVEACTGDPKQAGLRFEAQCAATLGLSTSLQPVAMRDGWFRLAVPVDGDRLARLTDRDVADLMARRPWDPAVSQRAAESLRTRGFRLAADRVAAWPTLSWHEAAIADAELARLAGGSKDAERARRLGVLRVLVHLAPNWPLRRGPHDAASASEAFDAGHIDDAMNGFVDALAANPSTDAMNMLAACALARGMPACAEALAATAVAADPNHVFAQANRMIALERLARRGEAIELARKIQADPTSSPWAKEKAARLLARPAEEAP